MNKHTTVQKNDTTYFTCKQTGCNFKTKSKSSWTRHNRLHNSGSSSKTRKPFKCSNASCGYRTRYSWNLKEHERIHDPGHLKSSQCSACLKFFSRQRDVARHQTTCRAFLERRDNNGEDESTDEGHLSEDEGQLCQDEGQLSRDEDPLSHGADPISHGTDSLSQNADQQSQDEDQLSQNEDKFIQDKVKKENLQSPEDELSQNEDDFSLHKVKKESQESHEDQHNLMKTEQLESHNGLEHHQQNRDSGFEENAEINMKLQVLMKVKRFKCPKCGHRSDNIQEAKTHLDSHSKNSNLLMCSVAECTSAGYVREDDLVKHLFEIHGIKKKAAVRNQEVPSVANNGTQVTEVPSTGRVTRAKKLQS